MTPFKAGLMFATVVAVVVFFVFGKSNPFEHPFILKAAFQNASNIGLNSPVRIAGVEVGRVSGLDRKPDSSAAVVTMKIRRDGLPIHRDAELKIHPRIFLEGNFFVDLSPGTPSLVPPEIAGVSLKVKSPVVTVTCVNAPLSLLQTKISELPSALQRVFVELSERQDRLLVTLEKSLLTKGTMFPL